ncbi:MAG: hypothetical protein SFU99_10160 [Saprospiraceae bacterium]|nr:hypothetical protein [Saprospiraceae bacterium]
MKLFRDPIEISLLESDLAQARRFADTVVNTVNYQDSNQFSRTKIRDDHFISKLGEEAVKQVFERYHSQVQGPDYTIYEGKQKSWEEDLYVNGIGLAVKTQRRSAAQRYGLSWTFQKSQFRTDPILQKPDAWVCFVEYNDLNEKPIAIVFPAFQMKTLPLKEPKLPHLKDKKVMVYAEDLLRLPEQI